MEFIYGKGSYVKDSDKIDGDVFLSEFKIYLKNEGREITASFIPLDKIIKMEDNKDGIIVHVKPSLYYNYSVKILLPNDKKKELIKDIVDERNFRKVFLKNEWVEQP